MINEKSLAALRKAQWTSHFKRPLYKNYAFSALPNTITKLLTGHGTGAMAEDTVGQWKKYDCAILFLIDGFGWKFFEKYRSKYPSLSRFCHEGIASKMSSEFPSTTAAHITTINTGMEVGQTGIYEWFYYEPVVDAMIAPLLFSYAGDKELGVLAKKGFTGEQIFPFETIYQKLAKKKVRSMAVQHEGIAHSDYSHTLLAGAEIVPYTRFIDALEKLADFCSKPMKEPTYVVLYFGDIDSAGHRHGVDSKQFDDAVDFCFSSLEYHFWQKLKKSPNKTAVMYTADHGMTAVDPKRTILLNKICPELPSMLKRNRKGEPLVPAGSCRDFFLHIEEEHLKSAASMLQEKLKGAADVVFTKELVSEGFFGDKRPSKRLKDRLGNLVVLPYLDENVFWEFENRKLEQHFYAAHGGLTSEEMESIFLFTQV